MPGTGRPRRGTPADDGAAVAANPTAVWLDSVAGIDGANGGMGLRAHLEDALAQNARYIQFVIHNLPEAGNTSSYRGRGFIQLTGQFNYSSAGQHLGVDLVGSPSRAATLPWSAKIARWYWTVARSINPMADRLDMAAVNVAIGYAPSAAEDAERCADFKAALRYFNDGVLPGGINCVRSFAEASSRSAVAI